MSYPYTQLLEAIKAHSGMEDAEIIEAAEHGADAGWPGFTYTVGGAEFYRANDQLIDELAQEDAFGIGYASVVAMVADFGRADMADTRDGRDCLMSWYALERVGLWLADRDEEV